MRFATDNGPDLVFERLNSRVLDRIVLVAEFQAPIDGRTDPVLFGVMEVRTCLSRPFLKSPDDGIVMYGRPRCCKGKTDLNRR